MDILQTNSYKIGDLLWVKFTGDVSRIDVVAKAKCIVNDVERLIEKYVESQDGDYRENRDLFFEALLFQEEILKTSNTFLTNDMYVGILCDLGDIQTEHHYRDTEDYGSIKREFSVHIELTEKILYFLIDSNGLKLKSSSTYLSKSGYSLDKDKLLRFSNSFKEHY